MLRRILAVTLLALGVMAAAPLAASAATGYQLDGVTDSTPAPGQTITVIFNGFKQGTTVTVTLSPDVVLGTFVSERGQFGQGVVEARVTIPSTTPVGARNVVATGVDANGQPKSVTIPITVTAPGSGSGLPATGARVLLVLAIGGLTTLLGWVLLGSTRRFRTVA